jgi:hypothetical protein
MPPIALRRTGKRLAEPLPNICILCGRKAVAVSKQTVHDAYDPQMRGKRVDMEVDVEFPVCQQHDRPYGRRRQFLMTLALVLFLLIFPCLFVLASYANQLREAGFAPVSLGVLAGLPIAAFVLAMCGRIFSDAFPFHFDRLTSGRLHLRDVPVEFYDGVMALRAVNDPQNTGPIEVDPSSTRKDAKRQHPPENNPFDFS